MSVYPFSDADRFRVGRIAITCFAILVLFTTATGLLHAQTFYEPGESNHSVSTLGAVAPEGAIVLFDGSNFDQWTPFSYQWTSGADDAVETVSDQKDLQWQLVDGKAMEIKVGFEEEEQRQWLCSREKFGDYVLHLEFRLPMEGNTNAGLFFGPLYELQIFENSWKATSALDDCGAIYGVKKPDVNAVFPRGQWQTYDLEYQHVELKEKGRMTASGAAGMTARLNGILIHDDVQLSLRRNKYGSYPEETTSRIILQDHGAKVQFRNIWLVEKSKKESPLEGLIQAVAPPTDPGTQLQLPAKEQP